jgi:hypothetical protein
MWKLDDVTFDDGGDGYWAGTMTVGSQEGIEVEIEGDPTSSEHLPSALRKLHLLDRLARDAMLGAAGREVCDFYFRHHVELEVVKARPLREAVLALRIAKIYPVVGNAELQLQWDYTIDEGLTNYVLVVWMDDTGQVSSIELES